MVDRERFVPRRVGRLTAQLCELDAGWGTHDGGPEELRALSRLVAALFHYEFHAREQVLIEAWDDGADVITPELNATLERANYTPVTFAELEDALERESLIPLRLEVDLDDYEELLVARRGSHREVVEIPKWRGLRTVEHTMTVDDRVIIHTRVKRPEWFEEQGIDPADRNLVPGHLSLKQFQNVPRADIEMLLPSTQVRFRLIDTLMVGVPAVVSGIAVLATKLAPTIGLIAVLVAAWLGLRDEAPELDQTALVVLLGGVLTLGGFLMRQWTKLKNRRVRYLKTLSENLYFRTLGDGSGVIHTLLATAEQQEVAEALLGYRFLLAAPEGLTVEELDRQVEDWLRRAGDDVDFEVDDAVTKLEVLDLIERVSDSGERRLHVVPIAEALARLDRRWDDLFTYESAASGPSA